MVMTDGEGVCNPRALLWLRLLASRAIILATKSFADGGSPTSLSTDEESQIRKQIEATDDEEARIVLIGDEAGTARIWADDLTLNAPSNQVVHHSDILNE
jgi:hypothetical protein